MTTNAGPHLFWITSRAAGSAALVLASLAVCLGLLMSTRLLKRFGGPDLRVAHEALSLATLVAIAVHGLALLGDQYLHPSIADISVPFAGGYKTWWTTLGIVSGWALAALGLSYYARARIGQDRWRSLHRFTALAWLLGLAHTLGEGTDAGQTWFLVMIGVVTVPALVLLLWRMSGLGHRRATPPAGAGPGHPSPPMVEARS
ncbi:MAG TPA: ferric reductase-like transmembrane domain-containing protein [Solirubrobacteraceae bacterium]|jgi:sulfoxide reductase heme-binding subunit YedZ|nr:ferric reductase-like transmembrane domain-containing protein [Solirubrobacteraceae bacterium]